MEGKVKNSFPQARFFNPSDEETLISMQSEDDVNQLIKMPPLTNWEGSFSFSKWSPVAGALSSEFIHNMTK
ncbi:hypothetical protein FRX31_030764, partial [Thalictrum thalictroides]